MEKTEFISRLKTALARERQKLLEQELRTDFAVLKRQRTEHSVPPRLYWTLKSLPWKDQVAYLKCLERNGTPESDKLRNIVSDRNRLFDNLELMEWAEAPSLEISAEQREQFRRRVRKTVGGDPHQYYKNQLKNLCKKAEVTRAFRACYFKTTGQRMSPTGDSVYADKKPLVVGDARIVVEWDCGGWTHFHEEIGVEWRGEIAIAPQSICSWLGYYPIGGEGWDWILKDDLEPAALDGVQQTIQFRDILYACVTKVLN